MKWSIGIYAGKDFCNLKDYTNNPVLTAYDVTNIKASFVADPFMVHHNHKWIIFFEAKDQTARNGKSKGFIGCAESNDLITWKYIGTALIDNFHLSYPYVFKHNNDFFMIPDCSSTGSVKLYVAIDFPLKWKHVKDLISGNTFVDTSPFYYNGKWWFFTSCKNKLLYLYYADDLTGKWSPHSENPVVSDSSCARPGGRIIEINNKIIRFGQNCSQRYGAGLSAFNINILDTLYYSEEKICDVLYPSKSQWCRNATHHIDLHKIDNKFIACIDGW
ncbi:MAG: glucosamine inositolphosphorylceramide transferase family protein [Atribacterota bacterium]